MSTETASLAPSEAMTIVNHDIIESSKSGQVTVPIHLSELLSPEELANYNRRLADTSKKTRIDRLVNRFKSSDKSQADYADAASGDPIKKVKMCREDYLAYWAKDPDGNYIGTNPPDKRREIWRGKLWAELYLPHPSGKDLSQWTGPNAMPSDFGPTRWNQWQWEEKRKFPPEGEQAKAQK